MDVQSKRRIITALAKKIGQPVPAIMSAILTYEVGRGQFGPVGLDGVVTVKPRFPVRRIPRQFRAKTTLDGWLIAFDGEDFPQDSTAPAPQTQEPTPSQEPQPAVETVIVSREIVQEINQAVTATAEQHPLKPINLPSAQSAQWPDHWKARVKAVTQSDNFDALKHLLETETSEAVKSAILARLGDAANVQTTSIC